jgi:DNA-binding SARP family transcriptional activator/TolB-like protein
MAIEIVTLGGLHVLDDEGELEWLSGQRSRSALLVYLAVERRASREGITAVFWPESDTESARHALRQGLYQIKKALHAEWVESRAHELEVSSIVRADVHEFSDAIARGDLDSAVRLYRGPFLDGVHLVDQRSWESWVDSKRAYYARTFRKACRDLVEVRRSNGDTRGAIAICELWVTRDPLDDEAQHRLIEALAQAGERAEAIRQYETYARTLEAESLEPPKQTRELIEQIRSTSSEVPAPEAVRGALDSAGVHRRNSSSRSIAVIFVVLLASGALFWGLRSNNSDRPPGPSSIVVLPFSVHGSESVKYLREGMVNLLNVALDGAGTLRPVDMRAMMGASDATNGNALDPRVIAREIDAGMYLMGDVVEAGDRLQIEAAIYRVGEKEAIARGVSSGQKDSVFSVADKLAAQLLAGIGDPHADRLLRTASVTTSSLPAFKEYLEGERMMRSGQFERAADLFQSAVARDSTFAVAYYRLALAREWAPLLGEEAAASLASHFGERLSVRDRNLLEAFRLWRSGRAVEAEQAYRAILARYPDDVDAWFQLGEIQFHQGPLLGRPLKESDEAWRKVLQFEKQNLFAVTHLARIAITESRVGTVDSLLARFSPDVIKGDRRLVELDLLRSVARGDQARSAQLTRNIRAWEGLASWRVGVFLTAFAPKPAAMSAIVRDLMQESESGSLRADILWFASLLDLVTGPVGESRAMLAKARDAERTARPDRRRAGFAAITEWYAATLPLSFADSDLVRIRSNAKAFEVSPSVVKPFLNHDTGLGGSIQLEPVRQYTIGMLSLRLGDTDDAISASAKLQNLARQASASSLSRDLDRGLRGRLAWERGRLEEALALLEQLECNDRQGDVAATPFASRAAERLLHGEILAKLGRDAEALRWFSSIGYGSVSEIPLRGISRMKQDEIARRMGSR